MKKLYIPLLLLFLVINGCFVSKEYPVEYDYNFLGDFDNYKSFGFFISETHMPEAPRKLVRSTIKRVEEKTDVLSDQVKEVKAQLEKIDQRLYELSRL